MDSLLPQGFEFEHMVFRLVKAGATRDEALKMGMEDAVKWLAFERYEGYMEKMYMDSHRS